ncbi:MAG: hypothetical protein HRU07_06535 [Nitrosopumilus sp.]|nr:hypothetical protein [Nitrosopumilus sp.]NRA05797.1 hypothetical protein [Nitrosopumilus sp.]
MGSQIIRQRKNKEYLYYAYYDNRVRKEMYCGLISDPKSKRKAIEFEIEELEKLQNNIACRLKILKKK